MGHTVVPVRDAGFSDAGPSNALVTSTELASPLVMNTSPEIAPVVHARLSFAAVTRTELADTPVTHTVLLDAADFKIGPYTFLPLFWTYRCLLSRMQD